MIDYEGDTKCVYNSDKAYFIEHHAHLAFFCWIYQQIEAQDCLAASWPLRKNQRQFEDDESSTLCLSSRQNECKRWTFLLDLKDISDFQNNNDKDNDKKEDGYCFVLSLWNVFLRENAKILPRCAQMRRLILHRPVHPTKKVLLIVNFGTVRILENSSKSFT